jgi:hypothetical protein
LELRIEEKRCRPEWRKRLNIEWFAGICAVKDLASRLAQRQLGCKHAVRSDVFLTVRVCGDQLNFHSGCCGFRRAEDGMDICWPRHGCCLSWAGGYPRHKGPPGSRLYPYFRGASIEVVLAAQPMLQRNSCYFTLDGQIPKCWPSTLWTNVCLLSLTSRGLCRWIFGPGPKRIIRYRYRRFCVVEGCRCCRLLLEIFHVSSPWPLPFRTRESAVQRYFRRLD